MDDHAVSAAWVVWCWSGGCGQGPDDGVRRHGSGVRDGSVVLRAGRIAVVGQRGGGSGIGRRVGGQPKRVRSVVRQELNSRSRLGVWPMIRTAMEGTRR